MNRNIPNVWAHLGLVLVLFCFLPLRVGNEQPKLPRLLILYEVGTTYPGINLVDQGIREVLDTSPDKLETYREYMDTILFPDPADQQHFHDFYVRKYQNRRPDVIITVGPTPLRFMVEAHTKAFPGVPIVFCMANWATGAPTLSSEFTGVGNDVAALETIQAALRLQPTTQNIVVVGGASDIDGSYQAVIKEQLRPYERNYSISYLTSLAMPDLVERLKHLPNRTVVLYGSFSQDATGANFTSAKASAIVAAAANVPVFSTVDVDFGHGEVGGKLSSLREQGRTVGGLAQRLLKGEKPQAIRVVESSTVYMFDWRTLKRWGFKESDLPPGSIVVNRPLSVWDTYKAYIVAGICLILLEALLISGLLWQRARRRQTNRALQRRTKELQVREELLNIFVKNVPAGVAMLDRDMRYLQVSDRWCADYGIDASQVLGRSHYKVFPDMPDRWREIHRRALDGETLRADEDPWDRKSGTTWVRWEVRPWVNVDGKHGGILIFAEDITRRKLADEALSSLSRKLIASQEQERTRIGRELHDDINQRLAMLAIELEQLQNKPLEVVRRLQELREETIEISGDVQALSHELHSSKLEYLGVVSGMKSWCKEFGQRQKVDIDFRSDVSSTLPFEIGLSLFRVLQEALNNVVKHSGAKRVEVQVVEHTNKVYLTVRDSGSGFEVEAAKRGSGIGLTSMQERVRLVNGEIRVESKPMQGTTIHVRIPLGPEECALQRAAG